MDIHDIYEFNCFKSNSFFALETGEQAFSNT